MQTACLKIERRGKNCPKLCHETLVLQFLIFVANSPIQMSVHFVIYVFLSNTTLPDSVVHKFLLFLLHFTKNMAIIWENKLKSKVIDKLITLQLFFIEFLINTPIAEHSSTRTHSNKAGIYEWRNALFA